VIAAGRLRERLTILRWSEGSSGSLGTPGDVWTPEDTSIACSRTDVSDGEKALSGANISTLRARFVVRAWSRTASVTQKDRVRHGGVTFEIVGIKRVLAEGGRLVGYEWTCEARVDA
jgi:head-tail adaptor